MKPFLGGDGMGFSPSDIARLKRQLASGDLGQFGVSFYPDGRVQSVQSDPNNPEDGRAALEALKLVAAAHAPAPTPAPAVVAQGTMLAEAIKSFLEQMLTKLPDGTLPSG
jgi:hypothetical protein